MADAISKQQAIDAIKERYYKYGRFAKIEELVWSIEKLPPIQPEIVRCKDCRYGILDSGFPHQYFCKFKGNEWNNDDYFCGHAKRREVTT